MVTVVMPAYKESEIIAGTVEEWAPVVSRIPGAELVIVDDCSPDNTFAILMELSKRFPCLKPVRAERNGGHGRALRHGFRFAKTEYVFQTDSDRQHPASEFWSLWEKREKADFVFGVRTHRADGWVRVVITRCMRLLNVMLWGRWIPDANCPYKLMRREALENVLARVPEDSFIPMVMISIISRHARYRIIDVPVSHFPRTGGEQSLKGLMKWVRVASQCTAQLLSLRWTLLFSKAETRGRLARAASQRV